MAAVIDTLIQGEDAVERVRDKIALILLEESAAQMALATAASEDPAEWDLRVFVERSNPWAEFAEQSEDNEALVVEPPIINISIAPDNVDGAASNTVDRQTYNGAFYVDCYALGVAQDDGNGGHFPGDHLARKNAWAAARLVRRILMHPRYVHLGMTGTVGRRMIDSRDPQHPPPDTQQAENIGVVRLTLGVRYIETVDEVQGETIREIGVTVYRAETGEVYLSAEYPFDS